MLTSKTVIDLPGLISPDRKPYRGDLGHALYDEAMERLAALGDRWGVDGTLPALAGAGVPDETVLRYIFDDPDATVIDAGADGAVTREDVAAWFGRSFADVPDEDVDTIVAAWTALGMYEFAGAVCRNEARED